MRQIYKMVKHIQTIRRLLPTSCLSVFDHFVDMALKGLITRLTFKSPYRRTWSNFANINKNMLFQIKVSTEC